MFYIKVKDIAVREQVIRGLKTAGVAVVFHYVPLHSAPAGEALGYFAGTDEFTTKESERLIRLPMWFGMTEQDVSTVIESVITVVTAVEQ